MLELFEKIEDPDIRFLSMCFGLAGLRLSEARGLTFKSFRTDDILICQQRIKLNTKKGLKDTMKSHNSAREVPLDPELKKAYQEIPINLNKDRLIIEKF